ncbi:MAG: hypothetical protein M5U26_06410 [Planctomycetota bacterium]|nr:hypothetical protein [Planctomycetota bacterium]
MTCFYRIAAACLSPVFFCLVLQAEETQAPQPAEGGPTKLKTEHLHNAVKLTDKLMSGAEPHDEASFAELQKLGVRNIITVDGAKPDVETAKKYGLRYVHIPIGYDGVPKDQALELAKAMKVLEGPIYVHCHHGKHRSPAAAAVGAVLCGLVPPEQAEEVLKQAGTDPGYTGLYKSAKVAKPLDEKTLDAAPAEFHETRPIPPMADVMVEMDMGFEGLTNVKDAGWKTPADHPDLDPPHVAKLLWEHFRETARTGDDERLKKGDFANWLKEGEALAKRMEELLLARKEANYPAEVPKEFDSTFKALKANCSDCHKVYRNPGRRTLEP